MKANNLFRHIASITAMATLGFVASCNLEDTVPLQEEASYVAEDAVTDAYYQDADDMANIVALNGAANGRIAEDTVADDRLHNQCVKITLTFADNSTSSWPIGNIVIDFSASAKGFCEDARGNIRKGKILIHFEGRRFAPESVVTLTFDGYSINDIKLEGTRTVTNITTQEDSNFKFQVVLENGKATWPDNTVATREHCFITEWDYAGTPFQLHDDRLIVDRCDRDAPAANGTNRRGRAYEMDILEPIVYKRGCRLPVSGIKQFKDVDSGKVITIDYGNGECDNTITITVDGTSRSVTVDKRG